MASASVDILSSRINGHPSAFCRPEQRCVLAGLPPELREQIYKDILRDDPPTLRPKGNGQASVACGLAAASREFSREFLAVVPKSDTIIGYVSDFRFRHIARFIDGLSDSDLDAFPKLTRLDASSNETDGPLSPVGVHKQKRRFIIALQVTRRCPQLSSDLSAWLHRFKNPQERGHGIDFEYVIAEDGLYQGFQLAKCPNVGSWCLGKSRYRNAPSTPGKLKPPMNSLEMGKIVEAFEREVALREANNYGGDEEETQRTERQGERVL